MLAEVAFNALLDRTSSSSVLAAVQDNLERFGARPTPVYVASVMQRWRCAFVSPSAGPRASVQRELCKVHSPNWERGLGPVFHTLGR